MSAGLDEVISPPRVRRVRGSLAGLGVGTLLGLLLGVGYWAPAAYFLSLNDLVSDQESIIGGFFVAIAGLAFFPITGGIFWTIGGALAGIIAGFGTIRRAGFTGAVLGMWVGGILGGLLSNATYQSAMNGILAWAAIGAPLGAIAGQSLRQNTVDRLFRGAMGIVAGMLVMALGGVWPVLKLADNNPALLAVWASIPVLTGLVGGLFPSSRQPASQAEQAWTTG